MGYKVVPISGWGLSARSLAAIPINKGMELLVPINSNVIVALGVAGLDNQLPDYFPDHIEFIDGLVYKSVGGVRTQLTLTGASPSPQNGVTFTSDFVIGRLGSGLSWVVNFIAPTLSAPIEFSGLTAAEDYYVYVWVEQSGQQVYAESPLVDISALDPQHDLTASIISTTEVATSMAVGSAHHVTAGIATTTQMYTGVDLQAAIQTTSGFSVDYPDDFRLRLHPIEGGLSDSRVSAIDSRMKPVEGLIQLSNIPQAPVGVNQIQGGSKPVQSQGIYSYQGQTSQISGTSTALDGHLGDVEFGGVRANLPDLTMTFQMDAGYTYTMEFLNLRDSWQFNSLSRTVLTEQLTLSDKFDFVSQSSQLVPPSSVTAGTDIAFSGQHKTLQGDSSAVRDNWSFQKVGDPVVQSGVTWAINLDTMASSQYTDYGFNSFFKYNGQDYGVADDGVYLLSGGSDNGTYINSVLDTGTQDFNIARNKYLPKIYLGYQSTARGLVDVIADGVTRTYETRSMANSLDVRRVDCGVGVRANYWGVTLRNYQGADFAVDSVRLTPILTLRRM